MWTEMESPGRSHDDWPGRPCSGSEARSRTASRGWPPRPRRSRWPEPLLRNRRGLLHFGVLGRFTGRDLLPVLANGLVDNERQHRVALLALRLAAGRLEVEPRD